MGGYAALDLIAGSCPKLTYGDQRAGICARYGRPEDMGFNALGYGYYLGSFIAVLTFIDPIGWEVTAEFAEKWWFLLDDTILRGSNFWRSQRGEQALVIRQA